MSERERERERERMRVDERLKMMALHSYNYVKVYRTGEGDDSTSLYGSRPSK